MTSEVEPAPQSGASSPASSPAPPSPVGRLLAGRYRLTGVLGEGGMAIVYEAENVAIGKRVALKLVQSFFAHDDEIVSRFEREARTASAVESEHIVHVFDVGADPELGLFLVMELLKGQDLARVLHRHGRLEPAFACGLIQQAAMGLEKAHAAGIVHRDLKPANVFLVERDDGTTLAKLVDFGIAKVVREAHDARFSRKGITRRGTAIGTPQYMSPEQAQGLETVDHRTDVFSLGAVLFEAIAGHPYMEERATYEQTILQLISTPAPRLSESIAGLPPALDDLVAEMLEHDPEQRVPDMRAVRDRLAAIYPQLQGTAVKLRSLRPPSSGDASSPDARAAGGGAGTATVQGTAAAIPLTHRRRRPLAAVALGAAAVGVLLGVMAWRRVGPPPASEPAASGPSAAARAQVAPRAASSPLPAATLAPEGDPAAPSQGAPAPLASSGGSARAAPSSASPGPSPASAPLAAATSRTGARPSSPNPLASPPRAPASAPPRKTPAAAAPPTDQVGAAGISSQF